MAHRDIVAVLAPALHRTGGRGAKVALKVTDDTHGKLQKRNPCWFFIVTPVVWDWCGPHRQKPISFLNGTVVKFYFTIRRSDVVVKSKSHVKEVHMCGDIQNVEVGRTFSIT